jgi:aldehyde dehydrogenase (NAD+)
LVGIIAGGNTCVIKPSEVSAATEAAFARLVPKYLDPEAFIVIRGAADETTVLLKERFDHIFYTGNGVVGRIVMRAAAEHLTPVTLELGGKSPCIIDRDADLDKSVPRLTWGKFYNAGQTCIAPDYVLVHKDKMQPLIEKLQNTIKDFYGSDPSQSQDYCKVINSRHTMRLKELLNGQNVVAGGQVDVDKCYISPTLVANPRPDSKLMQDEIFGPILPIIPINNLDEAIDFVNSRDKPLALYIFSKNKSNVQKVIETTSSGGVGVNECILHNICTDLPFGGVGPSGMGSYNGKHTFQTFTHEKGVLIRPQASDPSLRFPPYTPGKVKILSKLNSLELPSKKTVLSILAPLVVLAVAWWLGPEKISHIINNFKV